MSARRVLFKFEVYLLTFLSFTCLSNKKNTKECHVRSFRVTSVTRPSSEAQKRSKPGEIGMKSFQERARIPAICKR